MPEVPARLADALRDRYRVERGLGAGGMAIVYLAEDVKHHRTVAIKVLRPELAAAIGRSSVASVGSGSRSGAISLPGDREVQRMASRAAIAECRSSSADYQVNGRQYAKALGISLQ